MQESKFTNPNQSRQSKHKTQNPATQNPGAQQPHTQPRTQKQHKTETLETNKTTSQTKPKPLIPTKHSKSIAHQHHI